MISIFQGRKLSLDGMTDEIYAQVAVALREHIHLFSNGKNLNPFALFMKLALHTDQYGWSYPGRINIKKSTGISTDAAVTSSLKHLCDMRIDGHPVLAMYRSRNTKWGRTIYRIFPSAWNDELENVPKEFRDMELERQYEHHADLCHDDPLMDDPLMDDRHYKYNHSKEEPIKEENTIATQKESPVKEKTKPKSERRDLNKNGKPLNEHQKYFGALVDAFDMNLSALTQSHQGRMNRFAKQVKEGGYTLDDIRKAKLLWKDTWPGNTGQAPDESRFIQRLEVVRKSRVERGYG